MPQSSPMNWMFLSLSLSAAIQSVFCMKNKSYKSIKTNIQSNMKSKTMFWKW